MNRAETAISKLFSAFIKGELRHTGACSCAVGNLCGQTPCWNRFGTPNSPVEEARARRIIEPTRYDVIEIYEIEKSFEDRANSLLEFFNDALLNTYNDPDGFKGLSNVFDTLYELDKEYFEREQPNIVEMALI
jgi:hypothetical protein